MSSSNSTTLNTSTTSSKPSMPQTRGTFILTVTTIDDATKDVERITENIKISVIELMKLAAAEARAQPSNIIEIYVCDQELVICLLISCAAGEVVTAENFNRIRNIEFRTSASVNILDCIPTFLDKIIARQSTYYRDVFILYDDSNTYSIKTSFQESTDRRLREMRSVNFRWIVSSDQLSSEKVSDTFLDIFPVCFLPTVCRFDDIRRLITLVYEGKSLPSHIEKVTTVSTIASSEMVNTPVSTRTNLRFEKRNNTTSKVSEQKATAAVNQSNSRNDQRAGTSQNINKLFEFSPSCK
ncbi:unnamed protein product [Adineta steineri]|uniref:Uncharacterized protein n=4 Tax=Adineta steineri TaxID=433720 RepID=A0A815QS51_9BILA|nr:unnamed protein product [Adineta steineri]CAF3736870.1 unnamed protein product [Adineta steineri]